MGDAGDLRLLHVTVKTACRMPHAAQLCIRLRSSRAGCCDSYGPPCLVRQAGSSRSAGVWPLLLPTDSDLKA